MPTIASVQGRVDRCEFAWGVNDTVTLDYYGLKVADLGKDDYDRLQTDGEGKSTAEQCRLMAAFLAPLLAGWNVYEWEKRDPDSGAISEHGPMVPPDVEHIAAFDENFIAACLAAVVEHFVQGKVTGLRLSVHGSATSSPTDGAVSSPDVKGNRAFRRNAKSRKSPSNAA